MNSHASHWFLGWFACLRARNPSDTTSPFYQRMVWAETMKVNAVGLQLTSNATTNLLSSSQDVAVTVRRCLEADAVVDPAFDIDIAVENVG